MLAGRAVPLSLGYITKVSTSAQKPAHKRERQGNWVNGRTTIFATNTGKEEMNETSNDRLVSIRVIDYSQVLWLEKRKITFPF